MPAKGFKPRVPNQGFQIREAFFNKGFRTRDYFSGILFSASLLLPPVLLSPPFEIGGSGLGLISGGLTGSTGSIGGFIGSTGYLGFVSPVTPPPVLLSPPFESGGNGLGLISGGLTGLTGSIGGFIGSTGYLH